MKLSKPQLTALIANFSYILDISAFAIILPSIAGTVHATADQALTLYSIYGISLSAALLLGGKLTDHLQVRWLFIFGVSTYAIAASLITLADTYYSVLTLRLIQGLGAAIFSPCIPLIISRTGEANSAESLTLWGFWSGIAAAISPIILTYISVNFNWRIAWAVIPTIALAAIMRSSHIDNSFRSKNLDLRIPARKTTHLMLGYVFVSYGLTTWFIYTFPLNSGQIFNLSAHEIGIYSSTLWLTFAATCWLMKFFKEDRHLLLFLKLSPIFIFFAAATFHVSPLSVFFVGIAMGLANMPTTEIILRNARSSEYGLIASLDIVSARLGGAIFVILIPDSHLTLIVFSAFFCFILFALTVTTERQIRH